MNEHATRHGRQQESSPVSTYLVLVEARLGGGLVGTLAQSDSVDGLSEDLGAVVGGGVSVPSMQ